MCIFCGIVDGSVPSKCVYEDELISVFHDIHPKADSHLLMISKKHIKNLSELTDSDNLKIVQYMISCLPLIQEQNQIQDFRLVCNSGKNVGQAVEHLHFHILSGNISSQEL